jgi:hypothetical protein
VCQQRRDGSGVTAVRALRLPFPCPRCSPLESQPLCVSVPSRCSVVSPLWPVCLPACLGQRGTVGPEQHKHDERRQTHPLLHAFASPPLPLHAGPALRGKAACTTRCGARVTSKNAEAHTKVQRTEVQTSLFSHSKRMEQSKNRVDGNGRDLKAQALVPDARGGLRGVVLVR